MLPMQPYIRYLVRRKGYVRRMRKLRAPSLLQHFFEMLTMLVSLIAAHSWAMIYFENMSAPDALWLSLTTATTVGYGDISAETLGGRTATVLLLYVGGIALLAQAAGLYFEFRQERRKNMLTGRWRWHMRDHIVFINEPSSHADTYFKQAVGQLRSSDAPEAALPVLLAGNRFPQGLPDSLRDLDIAHFYTPHIDAAALTHADCRHASVIVLIAKDNNDIASDSVHFDLISRLRESGAKGRIICEVVAPENRMRLLRAGADAVLRPIRIYPEMLARAIISPGSEKIIENLFSSDGEECIRLDISIEGLWRDIAIRCIEADIGLSISYIDKQGDIRTAPSSRTFIEADGLFVIRRCTACADAPTALVALAEFSPKNTKATHSPAND